LILFSGNENTILDIALNSEFVLLLFALIFAIRGINKKQGFEKIKAKILDQKAFIKNQNI